LGIIMFLKQNQCASLRIPIFRDEATFLNRQIASLVPRSQ
jgi:hypothetical protein